MSNLKTPPELTGVFQGLLETQVYIVKVFCDELKISTERVESFLDLLISAQAKESGEPAFVAARQSPARELKRLLQRARKMQANDDLKNSRKHGFKVLSGGLGAATNDRGGLGAECRAASAREECDEKAANCEAKNNLQEDFSV